MNWVESWNEAKAILLSQAEEFAKNVAPIYNFLNWEWGDVEEAHVPSEEELITQLQDMIDAPENSAEVEENGELRVEAGGLEIYYCSLSGICGVRFIADTLDLYSLRKKREAEV